MHLFISQRGLTITDVTDKKKPLQRCTTSSTKLDLSNQKCAKIPVYFGPFSFSDHIVDTEKSWMLCGRVASLNEWRNWMLAEAGRVLEFVLDKISTIAFRANYVLSRIGLCALNVKIIVVLGIAQKVWCVLSSNRGAQNGVRILSIVSRLFGTLMNY